jgi:hypothetical protein
MNSRAMLALADQYTALLDASGAIPVRADLDHSFDLPVDRVILLNHVRWQLDMVRQVVHRLGGESTATRLLGSAQGLLLAAGLLTVGDMWRDNAGWLDSASVRAFDTAMEELDQNRCGHLLGSRGTRATEADHI